MSAQYVPSQIKDIKGLQAALDAKSTTPNGGYNLSNGLGRFFRSLGQTQMNSSGSGMGGVDIVLFGDSLVEGGIAGVGAGGAAGTSTKNNWLYDTWAHLLKVKLQAHYNPAGVTGGYGWLPTHNGAGTQWFSGTAPTAQELWTVDSGPWDVRGSDNTGLLVSGRGLVLSTLDNGTKRARLELDPTVSNATFKRQSVTRVDIIGAQGGVVSDWRVDRVDGSVGAFVTAGTGTASGAITGGGAFAGGYHFSPTVLQGLNPSTKYTVQLSQAATGSRTVLYWSGAILYNGDESCGIRVHNCGSWGRSSGSYGQANSSFAFPTSSVIPATLDGFGGVANTAQITSSGAVNAKLYVLNWLTNDVGLGATPVTSLAQYKLNMEAFILNITALPSAPCVLLWIPPCPSNASYLTNALPYIAALYELADKYPDRVAIMDSWKALSSSYANVYTGVLTQMKANADGVHFGDAGQRWIADQFYRVLTVA